jgi:hypothetical protein
MHQDTPGFYENHIPIRSWHGEIVRQVTFLQLSASQKRSVAGIARQSRAIEQETMPPGCLSGFSHSKCQRNQSIPPRRRHQIPHYPRTRYKLAEGQGRLAAGPKTLRLLFSTRWGGWTSFRSRYGAFEKGALSLPSHEIRSSLITVATPENNHSEMDASRGEQQVMRQHPEPVTDVYGRQKRDKAGREIEVGEKCVQ